MSLLSIWAAAEEGDEHDEDFKLGGQLLSQSLKLQMDHTVLPPSVRNAEPTIAGLEENFAYTNYRFRREDLSLGAVGMPETWIHGNGSGFDGETGLFLLLARLRYDHNVTISAVVRPFLQEHQQHLAAVLVKSFLLLYPLRDTHPLYSGTLQFKIHEHFTTIDVHLEYIRCRWDQGNRMQQEFLLFLVTLSIRHGCRTISGGSTRQLNKQTASVDYRTKDTKSLKLVQPNRDSFHEMPRVYVNDATFPSLKSIVSLTARGPPPSTLP